MWRRLWLVGGLAFAIGCNCGTPDGALKVVIDVDAAQKATCVVLEVSDGSGVQATQELERAGKNQWVVGLKQGSLPESVSLSARGFVSSNGCAAPRTFNGESAAVSATFPKSGVETVTVTLGPPPSNLDADRDGYVQAGQGGSDCNDADASIRPGAVELCSGSVDQDCDGAAACADSDCSATPACQRAPDRLAFVTPARSVAAGACSPVLTVETQDAAGAAPAQQGLAVVLTASPATGVTFWADANCTQAITTVTIPQGQAQGNFHFRATQGGTTFTASASVLGLTAATQVETVTFPAPTQLAFTTPPRTVAAAACSAALSVELRDAGGTATQAAQSVAVALSGAPATGLSFFSDAACATQLVGGALPISAGATGATFYARGTTAAAIALTAASTGLTSAQQTLTVTAGAAAQIRFTSSAQGLAVSTCSSPVVLTTQDANGNASPVGAATVATLSASPSANFTFYSDAACTTAITQVTVAQGASTATLYFRGTAPAVVQIQATTASLGNATQTEVIGAGPAAALAFTTAAQTVTAGNCSGVVTVQSQDTSGFPSNLNTALVVSLAASPASPLQFFSDAACSTAITQLTIAAATADASFYFRSTLAGPVQLTASSSLPTGAQQTETVTPAAAMTVAFLGAPQTVTAGICSALLAVETRDQFGNPAPMASTTAVALSSGPAGVSFFTAAGCSGSPVTQVNVGVAQSQATFYARADLANAYTLTAQTTALGNTTQGFTVTAGAATQLAFSPAAQSVVAGACSAAVQVQRRDAFGNPVSALASLSVGLSSTATSGLTFHSASDCNAPSAITAVDIPSNGSSATFYVRATVAEVVTVTGTGGGLTDATHALTVTPAAATALVLSPAAQSVVAGACSAAVQVQRRDAFGNPTTTGLLTVTLGSNATGGLAFHSAISCSGGSVVTTVDIADGNSSATFYVRPTVAEAVTVTASASGPTSGTHALTVTPAAAAQLTFSPSAQAVTAGVCSALVTVTRRDAFGNATTLGGLTVALTSNASGGLTFHSASDCSGGSAITDVAIAAGTSSATFYVRATAAQVVTVTGSGGGLTPATHALTVNPAAATQLVFNPAAQLVTAGACSAGITVTRRDAFNNPTTSGLLTVALTSNATSGLTFHTASDCNAGATITSLDIADGVSGATFYARATVAETVTVTGAAGTLSNATHTLTVNLSGPTQLVFTPASQTVVAGNCSAVVTVTRRDGFGNPTTSGLLSVALTSTAASGLTFHTAASCSGPSTVTSVNIADGNSSATFYVRATVAQAVTLTGAGGGLTPATHALTVDPGPAAELVFSPAAQSVTAGVCSAAVTVTRRDAFGNPTTSGALNVGLTSTATSGLSFHTASDCNGGSTVTQVSIADAQSTATFYLRATVVEPVTVTGAGGGLTNATQTLTINPAAATQLVFTPAAQTVTAGVCSAAVTVTRRDGFGNPTTSGALAVSLTSTATSGLSFHTASNCNGGSTVTQVSIADTQSATTFYVRATVAGNVTVTGAGGGLTDATHALTVNVAAAALVFSPAAQSVTAGVCSGVVTVTRRDAFGNPTTSGLLPVALTSTATSGLSFHTAASCDGPSTVTSVDIAAGNSSATFYVRATVAEAVTVRGNGGGLTEATHALTVNPAAASALVFTPAAQTVGAGVCSAAITVTRRDGFGNPTTSGLLTVALTSSAASGLTFHTASDCNGGSTATSVDLIDGSSATTFYVRATVPEVVNVFGNGGGLGQATHALTVNAGPATALAFTPSGQTVTAGVCSAVVTVTRRDQFNNLVTAGVLTVNLTSNATSGLTFHTAANCSGGSTVTSVDITDGNSAATLYVLATVVEPVTVTGSASGTSNATHTLTINPAAATALVFTPAAQTVTAGVCSAVVTVTRRDAFGNLTTSGLITVGLSSNASGGLTFHSANDCSGGSAITSVDIADAASSATFYVRATVVEPVTVQGTSGGLSTANHVLTINPAAGSQLVLSPAAQTVTAGACSAVVTVTRRDAFGNTATSGALAVGLSSNATSGLTFHSASDCSGGSTITGVNIADAASTETFYVRATRVEPVTVTASAPSHTDGTHALTIDPAAGSVLVFTPAGQTVTAGVCSAVVTVTRRDAFGNPTTSGATAVSLTSNATSGLSFHSASDCNGGSAITGVNIADAASTATFYLRATRVEPVTVTGTSGGFSDATHALTINPGPAYRTTFTSAPITVAPNTCSTAITVQQQDEFANAVAVGTDTTVTLTDTGTGFDFHLAAGCGDAATGTATITTGNSTTTFYVISPTSQVVTMTATISGLTVAGTQQATVTSTADHLAFTTPERTITSGDCSAILTVQRQDTLNNPVTGGGPLTVNLSSDATSGLTFWTDAACTVSAGTSVQISGGQSAASFYVRALVAEAVTLTAAGGSLTDATQTFTTDPGPATQLAFSSSPQSIPATLCSALTIVEQRDANQNPVDAASDLTVTLADQAGAPAVTFYLDPSCTVAVPGSQLTMSTGSSAVAFYFRGDATGTSTMTASAPSRTDGTQLATITPAPPTQLVFTPAATTVEAGFCQALTLERRDVNNQPTAPAAPTAVETLTVSPVVGAPRLPFQFFSDNTCTTTLAAPFNINGGASSTVVYVKGRSGSLTGTTPGQQLYTVTATATGLSNGTSGVTVNPMVRRRSAACTLSAGSVTCAITPNLTDISRTLLFFQATPSGSDNNPTDDTVTCRLRLNGVSGNAEVICERYGTASNIDIEWQTVSFPYSYANGGVTVQHVTGSCAAGATNAMPINTTLNAVSLAESFVLMSHRSTGLTTDGNDFFISDLETTTNLRFQQSSASTTCDTDVTFAAQVVSWAGASVARAVSAGGAGADLDVSQATPTPARTFLLYSSRMTGDTSGTAPNPDQICRRRLRGRMLDASTLRFTRGCTGADIQDISWEHVLLPANASVQGVQGTINATANSSFVTITQVDMTRAVAFIGGQGAGGSASGQTSYNADDRLGSALARTVFNSATRVDLDRITTSGTASWHVWTVEVSP